MNSPKWLLYAVLCIFWWGLFGFLSKLGSENLPPGQVQILFTFGTLPVVIPAWAGSGIRSGDRLGLTFGILTGVFAGIANLAVFAALERGKASLVQPISTLYPLVTVVLAVIVLKEKMNRLQVLGVILAVLAIWILSL